MQKRVKKGSESLKFPTVLDCQATYFYIPVLYFNVTRILDPRIIFATSNIPEVIYLLIFSVNVVLLKMNSTDTPIIGVRAGGARGAAAPPNFGQLSFFWAARENLGKACF